MRLQQNKDASPYIIGKASNIVNFNLK